MSNIIGFLESMGRDAALRNASRAQLLRAMRREGVGRDLQAAILGNDRAAMDALIGARETLYCSNFPSKPPAKTPGKQPSKTPPKKAPPKKISVRARDVRH